jgi:hypothetical protein
MCAFLRKKKVSVTINTVNIRWKFTAPYLHYCSLPMHIIPKQNGEKRQYMPKLQADSDKETKPMCWRRD